MSSLVSAVQSGSLGKKPRARSADKDSASLGDALSVLFGNVSARGVVQHKGLVDSLAEEFDGAADVTVGSRKRSSTSHITQAAHALSEIFCSVELCARERIVLPVDAQLTFSVSEVILVSRLARGQQPRLFGFRIFSRPGVMWEVLDLDVSEAARIRVAMYSNVWTESRLCWRSY